MACPGNTFWDPKFYEINWKLLKLFAIVIFGSNSLTLHQLLLKAHSLNVLSSEMDQAEIRLIR